MLSLSCPGRRAQAWAEAELSGKRVTVPESSNTSSSLGASNSTSRHFLCNFYLCTIYLCSRRSRKKRSKRLKRGTPLAVDQSVSKMTAPRLVVRLDVEHLNFDLDLENRNFAVTVATLAKTGLMGCVLCQSYGSSEATQDHRVRAWQVQDANPYKNNPRHPASYACREEVEELLL